MEGRRTPEDGLRLGRAAFLATVAAGIAGIAAAPRLNQALTRVSSALGDGGWRIYSVASPMPRFDPGGYRLTVGGAVRNPVELTWDRVAALPAVRQTSDFHCVTGWSVEDVRWTGVRGAALSELVRPLPEARYVTFASLEEPYTDQLTIAQFHLPDVLLATRMDDAPLSRAHGAPLRLVVPRMYGYKSVKWVTAITYDTEPHTGYWEANGYSVDAWVGDSNGL
ncbi:MAG: molybdopterin-dependent oxidoreductase [Thermoleophilia bacterium]